MKAMVFTFCALTAAAMTAPTVASDDETPKPATSAAAEAARPPAVPATPAAVEDILYARRFTLKTGYKFAIYEGNVYKGDATVTEAHSDGRTAFAKMLNPQGAAIRIGAPLLLSGAVAIVLVRRRR